MKWVSIAGTSPAAVKRSAAPPLSSLASLFCSANTTSFLLFLPCMVYVFPSDSHKICVKEEVSTAGAFRWYRAKQKKKKTPTLFRFIVEKARKPVPLLHKRSLFSFHLQSLFCSLNSAKSIIVLLCFHHYWLGLEPINHVNSWKSYLTGLTASCTLFHWKENQILVGVFLFVSRHFSSSQQVRAVTTQEKMKTWRKKEITSRKISYSHLWFLSYMTERYYCAFFFFFFY